MTTAERKAERGRPRDPEREEAILRAALKLLRRDGYVRMSVDAVAAEAGVSKPTIYLRFGSKIDLATAALASQPVVGSPTDTGDTRADLIAHLRHLRSVYEHLNGMSLLGTLLAEQYHHPELLARFRERSVSARRQLFRTVLERARAHDEIRPDADIEAAIPMLVGAFYGQYVSGAPFPPNWPEAAVDIVLAGLAARP